MEPEEPQPLCFSGSVALLYPYKCQRWDYLQFNPLSHVCQIGIFF